MTKNDGGPAFPFHHVYVGGYETSDGMSLRDYFAGQVLAGTMADPTINISTDDTAAVLAKGCYRIADAMIAERVK